MKTRIIILSIATAILVSFGATRVNKTPGNKADLQATSKTAVPIGGLGSEDH